MRDPFGALCRHCDVCRRAAGHGSLSGTTFVAKDLFAVEGHRNCAGNPDWLRTHEAARATAPVVRRLLSAGAELAAMATMDELAYSVAGRNAFYGTPSNPACAAGIPGGSSSGSAVSVAGALADFSIGTDTTGSVRTPAALCGVAGIRTTFGAVPTEGVVPLAPTFDTVGAFASDVGLLERVLVAIADSQATFTFRRAALVDGAMAIVDADVRDGLQSTLEAVRDRLRAVSAPIGDESTLADWAHCVRTIQAHDVWRTHGAWITEFRPRFGPGVAERFAAAARVTADERAAAERQRDACARRVLDLVADDTVLVLPTSPSIAPRRDASESELDGWRARVMALTSMANVSGCPQLSLPAGRVRGAPIALSLLGPPHSDVALARLARTVCVAR